MLITLSCKKELYESPAGLTNKITIQIDSIINISYNNADVYSILRGGLGNLGGKNITQHGHCWDTKANPDITKQKNQLGELKQPGSFSGQLTNLQPNTKYYVKGYIQFDNIVLYTDQSSFTTKAIGKPTVTTTTATQVTAGSAKTGGNVTDDGGYTVTARGVCWSTSSIPTILLPTKTNDGVGTGTFISSITGLSNGITYFVRAYATNNAGTSYGNQISFTTEWD